MATTLERAHRYVSWSYQGLAVLCVIPILGFRREMESWAPYLLVLCLLVVGVQALRWDRETWGPAPAVAVVVTVGAWIWAVWEGAPFVWIWPATVSVGLAARRVSSLYRWQIVTIAGALVASTGIGLLGGADVDLRPYLALAAVFAVVMIPSVILTDWTWGLFLELDDAREAAGELAAAQERLRFAADLHDIQGHTLQTIALKSELARRTAGEDPERAAGEMAAVEDLARQALEQNREVAHGYRHVGLTDELSNAENILQSAGIRVDIGDTSHLEGDHSEVFGLIVREAVTNIIRHAQATTVVIEAEPTRLSIRNDGVTGPASTNGSGLDGLRSRLNALGGTLTTSSGAGVFEVVATIEEAS